MRDQQAAGILIWVIVTLTLGASLCAGATPAQARAAFQQIRNLIGRWSGTDEQGKSVKTQFAPIAASTAVMETLSKPKEEDKVTIYSVDLNSIALVHYCPTDNQPRMRAIPQNADPKQLTFTFLGAGNLPNPQAGHEYQLVMTFVDRRHLTEQWTWRQGAKDRLMTFRFVRVRSAKNTPAR